MPLSLYLGFVLACAVLMVIPGPNVALIVGNSVAYGTRYGLVTVLATSAASAVQLLLTVAGMAAALSVLAGWLGWVRWAGVAYLLVLGWRQWRAPPAPLGEVRLQPGALRGAVLRGLVVSLSNPKTLLFYTAFLPQFLTPGAPLGPQLALLAVTYVAVAVVLDGAWAVLAGKARPLLTGHDRLRNRLTGGMLMGAGLGLALANRR